MASSRVTPNLNLTGKWVCLCVVYLLMRDSLVLWASVSLPERQYNLQRSLNPGVFFNDFYLSPPAWRTSYCHLWTNHRASTLYWWDNAWQIAIRSLFLFQMMHFNWENFIWWPEKVIWWIRWPLVFDCLVAKVVSFIIHVDQASCNLHHTVRCCDMEKNSLFTLLLTFSQLNRWTIAGQRLNSNWWCHSTMWMGPDRHFISKPINMIYGRG